MPNLTPIQNIILGLAATLAAAGYTYLIGKNPDAPITSELFIEFIKYVLITVAGWNLKSARAKYTGKLSYNKS